MEQGANYLVYGVMGVAAIGGALFLLNQVWLGAALLIFACIMAFGKVVYDTRNKEA